MSGASYTEEHIIDTDDIKDDHYNLSLTLEDTEDDFNIEDITENQVKGLIAHEENRFLLDDDEPLESTSSQINIIDRRVNNDKLSVKGKPNDSKSFRNTGNLITIDCDDEDDEEESELDDRRHSKFKSERVIRNVDKKVDEKDIPETLEAVVLDPKESQNGANNQTTRGNNNNYHNQRGKGRNFMVPSARPFIGNNSLSSMGLLPTPLQSFNRIHVNPNFKHLAAQGGPRLANPMEVNSFRSMRPRSGNGLHQQPRLLGLHRQMGPRPVSTFEEINKNGPFSVMGSDHLEALIASQSLDYDMEDHTSSHRFIPNNHNNLRPPLFNEPFVDNWSQNQGGITNHQPWLQHPNRPPMGNFQRFPSIFNHESNLRNPLLGSFQRGVQMNNSLFGNPPRHPHMHNRLPHLTFFNQPNFPLIHSSMEIPRGRSQRLESTQQHPIPSNMQRHQIPISIGYSANVPTAKNQGQKRPQSSSTPPRSLNQQDNKRQNNLNPIASTSSNKQNLENPLKAQESSPQSINKVTSSPGQRAPRPSTSNVNLKNIRPIKTINSNNSSTPAISIEARKAALLKTKAARRFLQKENMNRVGTSVKQVPVVDSVSSTTVSSVELKEDANEQNKDDQQPMTVDLDIDDEYKKKLEEQKRLREEIIRKKEERRKQMVAEKMKQTSISTTTTTTPSSSSIPSSSTSVTTPNSTLTTGQQLRRTTIATNLIERSPSRDITSNRFNQSPLKRKTDESVNIEAKSSPQSNSSSTSDVKKVEIKGIAQTTTKATIIKLCTSVGPIEDCVIDVTNAEKKAIVTFKSSQHARQFQSRFQRHLVDLCVIQVSLLW